MGTMKKPGPEVVAMSRLPRGSTLRTEGSKQGLTARGTGPTFLVTETAEAKALKQEGARHLGKTMVIGAQKKENEER